MLSANQIATISPIVKVEGAAITEPVMVDKKVGKDNYQITTIAGRTLKVPAAYLFPANDAQVEEFLEKRRGAIAAMENFAPGAIVEHSGTPGKLFVVIGDGRKLDTYNLAFLGGSAIVRNISRFSLSKANHKISEIA